MSSVQKIIKKTEYTLTDLLFSSGLKKLDAAKKGKQILIYHGVTKNARTDINARFISTETFERQIIYFKKNWQIVSLDDYVSGNFSPNKFTVTLTFDDGYENNLTEVVPILEKHKVPATFFITAIRETGFDYLWADVLDMHRLTGSSTFSFKDITYRKGKHEYAFNGVSLKSVLKNAGWELKKQFMEQILQQGHFFKIEILRPYFQLLDENQIKELGKHPLITLGSHGLYHNCLTKVELGESLAELQKSKAYLENLTQGEIAHFAYPDGDYNLELVEKAQEIGYRHQHLVDVTSPEHRNLHYLHERFGINPYMSHHNQLNCILRGYY